MWAVDRKKWRLRFEGTRGAERRKSVNYIQCVRARVRAAIHNQLSSYAQCRAYSLYKKMDNTVLQMSVVSAVLQGGRFRGLFRKCDDNNMITTRLSVVCSGHL